MKYIRILALFYAILALLPGLMVAQEVPWIDVNAAIVNPGNYPVPGALVEVKADGSQVVADANGVVSLNVPLNSELRISAEGYLPRVVNATVGLDQITLQPDAVMVRMPFRDVDSRNLLGGVSYVDLSEVRDKAFFSHPTDGLTTLVGGWNGNSLWGRGSALVVIDGIPRDASMVNAVEVDQISVIKGAAAVALYGPQAINGILYITTKRGVQAEQEIKFRVNHGIYVPSELPVYLGAAEYMTLFNEARRNDGLAPAFSQAVIDTMARGGNPYRFPDIDFYDDRFLNSAVNRTDINAEIYGGDENARYYASAGFITAGSLLDFGEGKNAYDNRFNIRGNVNVDLNPWLSAHVDAGAILASARGPQVNYWQAAANVRPTMGANPFHPLIPIALIDTSVAANRVLIATSRNIVDGKYLLGGTLLDRTNPFAEIYGGGHHINVSRVFMFNTGVDMDLDGITQGLAFRSKIGVDYSTSYGQGYNHGYRIHEAFWAPDTLLIDSLHTHETRDERSAVQYINNSWFRQLIYMSAQLDYARSFNNHNVKAMVLGQSFQYSETGVYQDIARVHLGGHLGYNFRNRYFLDFNSALMHTSRLAPGNRAWFSPTFTLGWRISEEGFMDGVEAIDNLMLTASKGYLYSDIDIAQHYLYSSAFSYRGVGWFEWAGIAGRDVTASLRGENLELAPPRRDELSFGFRASLFDRALELEGNYFSTHYSGGIVQATALFPSFMQTGWPQTSFVPFINYNEELRYGYDFRVRINQDYGDFGWRLGLSGTYYNTEILERPDVYDYAYRYREGRPVDGIWGWESAGFFADQADIDASPRQTFGPVQPGDIKYVDQNNDGVIDINDEVFLAKGGWFGTPYTLGVNLTLRYRGLTLFAQGVGRMGAYGMRNRLTDWVFGERKYSDIVRGRWAFQTDPIVTDSVIVDTRATATFPRLTTQSGENNFRNSDFWLISTDYFELTRVQLTYSLPRALFSESFIRQVDLYVNGYNLLMISPNREILETNVGSAPQMRSFNLGLTATF